jgi:hypothetical protein
MAYLDKRLATGEQPIRREHQHWFVVAANARYAFLAWLVAAGVWILSSAVGPEIRPVLGWVMIALVVGGLLYLLWQILRWQNEEFVVTSRRVLQTQGVINKQIVDSSLEKINDAHAARCRWLQASDARFEARARARAVRCAADAGPRDPGVGARRSRAGGTVGKCACVGRSTAGPDDDCGRRHPDAGEPRGPARSRSDQPRGVRGEEGRPARSDLTLR